ncbi:transglutaminase-like domain-containing protein [Pelagicoccus albus]|uniref:Transglutaminase family protein n=1 Tax=Pelagicoccus albus TaxID=415222 RepID=A0A7X1B6J5_9BACT|nr:transglutaminase family protein [Pelagicoccus albus]MBC2606586.1 transglutaminase family protein [Pelagicoccus albus]
MSKSSQRKELVPSGRELIWFIVWLGLALGLVFLAKNFLAWDQQGRGIVEGSDSYVADYPVIEIAEDSEFQAHPQIEFTIDDSRRPRPINHAKSQNALRSVAKVSKGGWSPDSTEEAGDARRIYPEEIRWLQNYLNGVEVHSRQGLGDAYRVAKEFTKQVGEIPYARQTHGWGLPDDTLRRNEGDCADKSLLLAELLISSGIEEVAICIGVSPDYKPGEAGHAWVQAMIGGRLWRIESTNGTMRVANSGSPLDRYETIATIWRHTSTS